MTDDDQRLPPGAVLVHVGPYKTGTSAIQMALHTRRAELDDHGVAYPGTTYRHMRPSAAVLGRGPRGVGRVPIQEWDQLVADVREAAPRRSVVSSEGFAAAKPEQVEQIADDLGRDHVHVLAVARRLDRLLPSVWQERVKSSNETRPYADWLDPVLAVDLDDRPAQAFWHAHGLSAFLEAWGAVLPPERIVLVVGDERDHRLLPRTFEHLLGLPSDFLRADDRPNSSLSWDRVELYRRLNEIFGERGWSNAERRQYLQKAMLPGLRDAGKDDLPVRIPPLDAARARRVAELSRDRAALVEQSGVTVIGDPKTLLVDEPEPDPTGALADAPTTVSVEAAARAVEGVVAMALRRERSGRRQGQKK